MNTWQPVHSYGVWTSGLKPITPERFFEKGAAVETPDIDPESGCTYIGDICRQNESISDDAFDCVVCTEVIEHRLHPFDAVDEIWRILKPGGNTRQTFDADSLYGGCAKDICPLAGKKRNGITCFGPAAPQRIQRPLVLPSL